MSEDGADRKELCKALNKKHAREASKNPKIHPSKDMGIIPYVGAR